MVKKEDKTNKGGALDLGTVLSPVVLYGLRRAMDEKSSAKGPRRFGKRMGGDDDLDKLFDLDNQNKKEQDGGKKKKKGGDDNDQDGGKKKKKGGDDKDQDGGKKKKKGGDDNDQDGGRRRRVRRGGADDLSMADLAGKLGLGYSLGGNVASAPAPAPAPAPAVQAGGKKRASSSRKYKGGALDQYAEQLREITDKLEELVRG